METKTRIIRNRSGKLEMVTDIRFDDKPRVLTLETSASSGSLRTDARVDQLEPRGGRTHAFGITGYGRNDFRKSLAKAPGRGTEKAIRAQHESALADVQAIIAEAIQHYEGQQEAAA